MVIEYYEGSSLVPLKVIETLVEDIYARVLEPRPFAKENVERFTESVRKRLEQGMNRGPRNYLSASILATACPRHLWYRVNKPELAETLLPSNYIKFFYGDALEALLLLLAREAGHKVEGEQDVLWLDGVQGSRDCVIDGVTVDCKSTSPIQFEKFKEGRLHESDPFGYMAQLDFYTHAAADDVLVVDKDHFAFLAIEKSLGKICLLKYEKSKEGPYELIDRAKSIVALPEPPACECEIVPKGKSGNMGLGIGPSYSSFKYLCRPDLRTFIYAGGAPEYLTKVVRKPKVTEVDKNGNVIFRDD